MAEKSKLQTGLEAPKKGGIVLQTLFFPPVLNTISPQFCGQKKKKNQNIYTLTRVLITHTHTFRSCNVHFQELKAKRGGILTSRSAPNLSSFLLYMG